MERLKELYLSIFLLFFRISRWEGRMKASSASLGVSVVLIVLALTLWALIQMVIEQNIELNRWMVVPFLILLIAVPSDYYLVIRSHGIAFEKQFRNFSRSKQIGLYLAAITAIVVTGIAFYFTIANYHQTFGLSVSVKDIPHGAA